MKIDIFYDKQEKITKFSTLEPLDFTRGNREFTIPAGFVSDGVRCAAQFQERMKKMENHDV